MRSSTALEPWNLVFGTWLIATLAALGALFFSNVMNLVPCTLCWWQRIAMFPLVVMLPFALFPAFDRGVIRYALPLAALGWLVSAFQVLLVWGVVPKAIAACVQGIPCDEVQWRVLGFVDIPFLSFLAFTLMNALLIAARQRS